MTDLIGTLRKGVEDASALAADWALVGGLAVSVRAEPRTTRDVDIAVAVATDREAEQFVRGLIARGYVPDGGVEQTDVGRLATMRMQPPGAGAYGPLLDVLFASSGIENELSARAELLEIIPGLVCPVAQIGDLIALKLLSRDDDTRPQDAVDLRSLLGVATPDDLATSRAAVVLIEERGFARGRDLPAALSDALLRYGGTSLP